MYVDVSTNGGQTVIAHQELTGRDFQKKSSYQDVQIRFSLQQTRTVEFRVYSFAVADIGVDKMTVKSERSLAVLP